MDARFLISKNRVEKLQLSSVLCSTIRVMALSALAIFPLSNPHAESTGMYGSWDKQSDYLSKPMRQEHVIQAGESLSQIGEMYGIPAALLAHHNGIPDPENITVGQVIYLPDNKYPEELMRPAMSAEDGMAMTSSQTASSQTASSQMASSQMAEASKEQPAAMQDASPDKMSGQDFGSRPYAYYGNSEPAADVLRNFAANYSVPIIISAGVGGVVNGRIGPLAPVEFLDKVAQLHALIWYFDGNTLYVYSSNEIDKEIINLQFIGTEEFRKTLMEIGIWDSRFYWRARPEEGIIYLSGPPRYMELVSETAHLLDGKSGARQKSQLTVKVFPLRYAWADDRTFNFRDQNVIVPGVATVLRQIAHGGGISAAAAPAAAPAAARSVPGVQPVPPAGQMPAPAASGNVMADTVFINADRRLNAVIIHDLESKMSMYESLINTLDKPLAQVEINVSIIDINTNSLDQLGINWRLGKDDRDFIRFNPFKTDGDSVPANTFSTIINITSGKLLARVNLLSDTGKAKVLARPSVLTLDNTEAVLDNSQTFYVRVAGQEAAELFPVTYGSVLKVTPRIVAEPSGRKLHLSVNIQDGGQAAGSGVDNIPVVKNSSISTQAVINENESLLIGGYYYEENIEGQSKVPILGDMPFVGAVFRNKTNKQTKNVRLFLITPRIVNLM